MSGRRRRSGKSANKRYDVWGPVKVLPPPEPIRPAVDAGATLRSLGEPPLGQHGAVAGAYMVAVVERAANVAVALAATAGLLEMPAAGAD